MNGRCAQPRVSRLPRRSRFCHRRACRVSFRECLESGVVVECTGWESGVEDVGKYIRKVELSDLRVRSHELPGASPA